MAALLALIFALWALHADAQFVTKAGPISATQLPAPTFLNAFPTNPTGTTSTTLVQMGAGSTCHITPTLTGAVVFQFTGFVQNNTANDGWDLQGGYGTGAAPANGAALTGNVFTTQVFGVQGVGGASLPFALAGVITGLTVGTLVWFDVRAGSLTGGTTAVGGITCMAFELH
ncbi:MAG TPA: hypothetical protein VLL82_17530 [Mycobacterium sp.]|nr:hypothetical protein [Mycobacterium sp.]